MAVMPLGLLVFVGAEERLELVSGRPTPRRGEPGQFNRNGGTQGKAGFRLWSACSVQWQWVGGRAWGGGGFVAGVGGWVVCDTRVHSL